MRIQARAAVAAITTTMIIYTTGWGPMIIIGYALGIADVIHNEGSDGWWPATVWMALGVLAGQILIATGFAPTMLPVDVGNAVAFGNVICVAIVMRMFALAAQSAKEAQCELRRQANTDALTGLANRAAITRALEEALDDRRASVMFVDLDGFKEINDRLGHERGDAVLVEAADRIATSLGRIGKVGRLGGDEFLVVLPPVPDRDLVTIADRILDHLSEPWTEGGAITASIGIATAVEHESADRLLDRADGAMYDAKSCGQGALAHRGVKRLRVFRASKLGKKQHRYDAPNLGGNSMSRRPRALLVACLTLACRHRRVRRNRHRLGSRVGRVDPALLPGAG